MSVIQTIPFHGTHIQAVDIDGKPHAVFRPLVESIGMDADGQLKRLKRKSWACPVMTTVQVGGQRREVTTIDLRTLTMWLATIDENRVSDEARPLVIAYQNEAADVLTAYWTKGGAVNPRASEHQLNALMRQSQMQMELCQAARGLVHQDHLEAKARIVLARGLGEAPEIDPLTRPLYAQDFLKEKNLSKTQLASKAGVFGKRLKKAYTERHGKAPEKYDLNISNGQVKRVNGYTEADRPLMDAVWNEYFAAVSA